MYLVHGPERISTLHQHRQTDFLVSRRNPTGVAPPTPPPDAIDEVTSQRGGALLATGVHWIHTQQRCGGCRVRMREANGSRERDTLNITQTVDHDKKGEFSGMLSPTRRQHQHQQQACFPRVSHATRLPAYLPIIPNPLRNKYTLNTSFT